jgi:hypothetical protein
MPCPNIALSVMYRQPQARLEKPKRVRFHGDPSDDICVRSAYPFHIPIRDEHGSPTRAVDRS